MIEQRAVERSKRQGKKRAREQSHRARVMKSSPGDLAFRESSLPSTAHAPMSSWLPAPRRVSRARNSALRVFQGRGLPKPQPPSPWRNPPPVVVVEKHDGTILFLSFSPGSDEKAHYSGTTKLLSRTRMDLRWSGSNVSVKHFIIRILCSSGLLKCEIRDACQWVSKRRKSVISSF